MKQIQPTQAGYTIQGCGRPVVLLHSSMSLKSQWRCLMESLSRTHRVIAIDLLGYGETPFPSDPANFSLMDEVRLVESVLSRVLAPSERFHVVGHSYGGGVALRLAYRHSRRVRSLTLFEPTAFHLLPPGDAVRPEIRAVAESVERGLERGDRAFPSARFIDYWAGDGAYARLPAAKRALLANILPKVPLDFRALIGEPLTLDDYRRIALPVCLIAGTHSRRPALRVTELLSETLPDSRLYWVEGGHMSPTANPDAVNPIIEGFLHQVNLLGVSFQADDGEARDRRRAWPEEAQAPRTAQAAA
jgi:pimeloyl-ACP methyl ester carboxylesterase